MRHVSQAFARAVSESHAIATEITLLSEGAEILTISAGVEGSVTLDAKAATRGRLDLTVVDDGSLGLIPLLPLDPLSPYGNEIHVKRGVTYQYGPETASVPGFNSYPSIGAYPNPGTAGSRELVGLGVYRIDDVNIEDSGTGQVIRITGQDRSARIIDAKFEEPYQIAYGTDFAEAIFLTIAPIFPGLTYEFVESARQTPALLAVEGEDRWKFAQDMATSLGMTLYFDGDGVLIVRPVSSFTTTPSVTLAEGDGGVLVSAPTRWTRQDAFNRVIATGENTTEGGPYRGVATDENPLSPTYYYGPFGRVPKFYSSPMIRSDDQALDAAVGILNQSLGTTQQVSFGMAVNPALEPDDTVLIQRAATGLNESHVIDQVTIPLAADGVMSGTTRASRVF